jgi:hypothetical protein
MSSLFSELNAPLRNSLWSWGSVRESDRTVFLRVWEEGYRKIDDRRCVWVCDTDGSNQTLGGNERRRQVELIKEGYRAFMIMCKSEDGNCEKVIHFNDEQLFVAGRLIEFEGQMYLEYLGRIDVELAR